MGEIWEFVKYALWCAGNLFISVIGKGETSEHWVKDTIVGFITFIIILFLLYWLFRLTGLLKIEK